MREYEITQNEVVLSDVTRYSIANDQNEKKTIDETNEETTETTFERDCFERQKMQTVHNSGIYDTKGNQLVSARFTLLQQVIEDLKETQFASEEEKQQALKKAIAKARSGKKLTAKERNLIRQEAPDFYMQLVRAEMKRKSIETQLQHCRSKKEAQEIISNEISLVSKDDPERMMMINTIEETAKEFQKSDKYKSLPEEEDDTKN